jgi:hypothetical protein
MWPQLCLGVGVSEADILSIVVRYLISEYQILLFTFSLYDTKIWSLCTADITIVPKNSVAPF